MPAKPSRMIRSRAGWLVSVSSGLSDPIGLTVTPDGNLLIANLTGGRGTVSRFQTDGTLVDNPFITEMPTPVGLDLVPAPGESERQ